MFGFELITFDVTHLIQTVGLIGVFLIVFAESGLLIGFFLPGDSLLFTAGFLASQGYFNLWFLLLACFAGAVLGDSAGYAFGKKMGPRIFTREDSILFHKEHLFRAKLFYERHGKLTIVLARFVPFGRTFAPILAGVGGMAYGAFLSYNILGGFLWTVGLTLLGYWLGNIFPGAADYIFYVVAAIIAVSVLPAFIQLLRSQKIRGRARLLLQSLFAKLK